VKSEGENSVWLVFELWLLKEACNFSIELWRSRPKVCVVIAIVRPWGWWKEE